MSGLAALRSRPIRASDVALLRAFVQGLSRDTAYQWLLSGRTPTEPELRAWTSIDHARERAVVAVTAASSHARLAGVARYVMQSPEDTEFAVVIADDWQRRGAGRALLQRLLGQARVHGVRRMTGVTLAANTAMLSLARSLGFEADCEHRTFTTRLTLDLSAPAMAHKYYPVSCEFHEALEALASTHRPARIRYRAAGGELQTRNAVIDDVFSREGAEYIAISSGETLRLDALIAVDEADFAG
ncbi:MAG TPA: GNAT family N-acetyltransferase [Ramlibacter sp.]|jgi:acetyltransferase|nr:GNAT family N-acetyltransferase [Ramlibacter sp.]